MKKEPPIAFIIGTLGLLTLFTVTTILLNQREINKLKKDVAHLKAGIKE